MRSRCADLPATRARRPSRGARGAASLRCPYLFDWPEEAGLARPSSRPRVSPRLVPDAPDGAVVDVVEPDVPEGGDGDEEDGGEDEADVLDRGLVVAVVEFGRVVVVVVLLVDDFGRVVVVVVGEGRGFGAVPRDDCVVEPRAVVVVVEDLDVEPPVVVV